MATAAGGRPFALLAPLWVALATAPAPTPSEAAMIGEPVASVPHRQLRLESEFDYSQRDVTVSEVCCLESDAVRLLVRISGGIGDRLELFGRLGGVLFQSLSVPSSPDIDGSASVAIGGGLKATLYRQGAVAWGAGAQVLFHEAEDDDLNAKINWNEIDLFVGPSIALRPDLQLYGGLLGSLIVGELSGPGGAFNLDERTPLGIFLGGRVTVTRAALFGLELRLIDELAVASRVGVTF